MLSLISDRGSRILARLLCAALLLTLAPQPCAQQVSPALLKVAQEAYRQQQQRARVALATHLDEAVEQRGPALRQASAQPAAPSDWHALYQLRLTDRIACQTRDGVTHHGKFRALSAEAIALQVGKSVVTFPREQVASVKLLRRGYRGKTALLGAGIGFGVAAPLATLEEEGSGGLVLVVGTLFGLLGAAAGAIIGWPQETIIYRANLEHTER